MKPLKKAKLRIAYRIAETLEKQFRLMESISFLAGSWDQDRAAQTINILIPDSNAEAEEELEEIRKQMEDESPTEPMKPSCMDELREVLGCGAGMSIVSVIKLATQEIKQFTQAASIEADEHSNQGLM